MREHIPLHKIPKDILSACHLTAGGNHVLRLKQDVIDWCKENNVRYRKFGSKEYHFWNGFSFSTPEDAMAFKLRWFGGASMGTFGFGTII